MYRVLFTGSRTGRTARFSLRMNVASSLSGSSWCQRSSGLVFWDVRSSRPQRSLVEGAYVSSSSLVFKRTAKIGYFFLRLPEPAFGALVLTGPFLPRNLPSFLWSLLIFSRILICASRFSVFLVQTA